MEVNISKKAVAKRNYIRFVTALFNDKLVFNL